jgi:hypothetical protein
VRKDEIGCHNFVGNLRKHGQREAAMKRGGYAAIRRILRPRRGGGADP